MKEFFADTWELLTTNPDDGFLGYVILGFLWVLIIVLIGLSIWGILYLIDTVGMPTQTGAGIIIDKSFSPAHSTTTFMMSGKVMIPITTFHSDAWYIYIQVNDIIGSYQVSNAYFDFAKINQHVDVEYSIGRIWNSIDIKNIIR